LTDLEEITDEVLEGTRKMLALYESGAEAGVGIGQNGGFQLGIPENESGDSGNVDAGAGAEPIETDIDAEEDEIPVE
jgi:hypothetical protein